MTRLFPILHCMLMHHNVSLPQPRSSLAHLVGRKCSGVPLLGAFSSYLYIHSPTFGSTASSFSGYRFAAMECRMYVRSACAAHAFVSKLHRGAWSSIPFIVPQLHFAYISPLNYIFISSIGCRLAPLPATKLLRVRNAPCTIGHAY